MAPVSSVAVFVARYGDGADPVAAEVLASLDGEERAVIGMRALPAAARGPLLRPGGWSDAYLSHVEQRAFVHVRRELQRRGLWQP